MGLPLGALAQDIRQGSEFQVNTYTTNSQRYASVAADADGDFVVAWQSYGQDGSSYGVFARRFSSAGASLASEFQVNSYTTSKQSGPSVAADTDGDFVVAWESSGQDGLFDGVFARSFSSAGAPLASEFQVNSYTASYQHFMSVAAAASGDFVIAWQSYGQDGAGFGVFAQRFAQLAVLDVDGDGDGSVLPLTDGILVLRFLFSFTGTNLTSGAVGDDCDRCEPAAIALHMETLL